jgi:hypothetical protein
MVSTAREQGRTHVMGSGVTGHREKMISLLSFKYLQCVKTLNLAEKYEELI